MAFVHTEFVKSKTNGLTAKSFNLNFARLYDQIDAQKSRPSNIWSGDEEARGVVEQLIRDAGYDPMYAGGMDKTAVQEQGIGLIFAISQASGPYFYRMAAPDELSVPEVAAAGKHHRRAGLRTAAVTRVALEPPGWIIAVNAGIERSLRPVGKREERI